MRVGVYVFFLLQLNILGLKLEKESLLLQSIYQPLPTTKTSLLLPSNDPTIRRVIGVLSVKGRERKSSVSCMPTVQFHFFAFLSGPVLKCGRFPSS